ncbi:MAG: alpha/beta hydrolase fold protein [Chthonomonadales bacterium]|nr:alpha/beta hydrolase fold protein [Chthonomonadales bacterium]
MNLLPLQILPLWTTSLLALSLLGGGSYMIWDYAATRFVNMTALIAGVLMLALALTVRPLAFLLCERKSLWRPPLSIESDSRWRIERPDGTVLSVEAHGPADAPTILMTHGWGLDSTVWCSFRKHLAGPFRLVTWDLPGLGRSKAPKNGDYSLEKMAADLEAVLNSCGEQPVILLGHSIGGMITLTFCRLFPHHLEGRVTGLVLQNTTYTDPLQTIKYGRLMRALRGPVLLPLLYLHILFSPLIWAFNLLSYLLGTAHLLTHMTQFGGGETAEQLEFATRFNLPQSPAVKARGILAMFRYDATTVLPTIPVPVLICTGGRDVFTSAKAGETLCEQIPRSQKLHIDSAGHLTLLEHNERFCQAVSAFGSSCLLTEPSWARTHP